MLSNIYFQYNFSLTQRKFFKRTCKSPVTIFFSRKNQTFLRKGRCWVGNSQCGKWLFTWNHSFPAVWFPSVCLLGTMAGTFPTQEGLWRQPHLYVALTSLGKCPIVLHALDESKISKKSRQWKPYIRSMFLPHYLVL